MKITEYQKQYEVKRPKSYTRAVSVFDWLQSIVIAVTVLFVVFCFLVRPVCVSGDSMNPTLNSNDWLLVSAFDKTPQNGEIVVVTQLVETQSKEPIIKRVIAVAGQQVYIDFELGAVYVDGVLLKEPYIAERTYRSFDVEFPLTVPEGYVFVMGDNRNDSLDSRSTRVGLIDERYILGKVVCRVFPFKSIEYRNYTQEE